MYRNYTFGTVNEALPMLLNDLLHKGDVVPSRAGTTLEMTHVGITLTDPLRREISVPNRKANVAAQIAETMWVLRGHNDIGWLSHYLPRARDFSDDGSTWRAGYGPRLRHWPAPNHGEPIDQFRTVLDVLRASPGSRQAVMSIWDPAQDYKASKDIPCNNWLSWSIRNNRLDLHVAIRSNDVVWGWSGINQFEWSALLEILAGMLAVEAGSIHYSTTSFHMYERHFEKAKKIVREAGAALPPFTVPSPRFNATGVDDCDALDYLLDQWFAVEKGIRAGEEMSHEIEAFPEPMLQSWLRVLAWWWTGEREYLAALEGTDLEFACVVGVQPPERDLVNLIADDQVVARRRIDHPKPEGSGSDFIQSLVALHLEKHAAYGDSWMKRGEFFSILPNVGRKVDRLGGAETADETSADTAGDLFVYLAKYLSWLTDPKMGEDPRWANSILLETEEACEGRSVPGADDLVASLKSEYERLLELAEAKDPDRRALVIAMLSDAYMLARLLWEKQPSLFDQDEYRGADAD
jgi:thymidylate synthase